MVSKHPINAVVGNAAVGGLAGAEESPEQEPVMLVLGVYFFFSSRRRHTRLQGDWSSDVCSSDLFPIAMSLSWLYEFTPEGIVRSEARSRRWKKMSTTAAASFSISPSRRRGRGRRRSEERRVGKECRSRWSPDH